MTPLERRYRRLLAAYPAAYRAARADEIVDTYLAGAAPGRRWPTPADAADLVAGGLGERLRANRSGRLAAGARLAASLSLVAAVVLAGVWLLWIEIEPVRGIGDAAPAAPVGPFRSLAGFAWLAWLAAALVSAARPGRSTRLTVLAATLLTAAVVPVAAGTGAARPPLLVLLPQVTLGLVALCVPSRPSLLSRLAPVSAVVVVALLVAAFPPAVPYSWAYRWYAPDLLPATGLALLLTGLVGAGGYAVRRDDRGFWAALLLLPPAAMLGTVAVSTGLSGQAESGWRALAGTTAVLAVLTVAATPVAILVRGRVARRRPAAIGAYVGPAA